MYFIVSVGAEESMGAILEAGTRIQIGSPIIVDLQLKETDGKERQRNIWEESVSMCVRC